MAKYSVNRQLILLFLCADSPNTVGTCLFAACMVYWVFVYWQLGGVLGHIRALELRVDCLQNRNKQLRERPTSSCSQGGMRISDFEKFVHRVKLFGKQMTLSYTGTTGEFWAEISNFNPMLSDVAVRAGSIPELVDEVEKLLGQQRNAKKINNSQI